MEKFVICASAQAGNGKDVVTDYLHKELATLKNGNIHWIRSSFAYAVKQIFMESFGVDFDFIEHWKRIDNPPPGFLKNIRKSLQFIGDGFRQIQDDIWINICLRNRENQIISDGRYINEARSVKSINGFNFLIYRPGAENNDPNPSESQIKPIIDWCAKNLKTGKINHQELINPVQGLEYYDFFLINDAPNLEGLYKIVDNTLFPEILKYFNI